MDLFDQSIVVEEFLKIVKIGLDLFVNNVYHIFILLGVSFTENNAENYFASKTFLFERSISFRIECPLGWQQAWSHLIVQN